MPGNELVSEASTVRQAYGTMYQAVLVIIGLLLLFCLVRAVRGPRLADRVVAVNMMGTLIVIAICILSYLLGEGYLVDVAIIYTMLSFLAVVLLTRLLVEAWRKNPSGEKGGGQ